MRDETCRICGQPYAHLFGCPQRRRDRAAWTWRCPDTFPKDWLRPIRGAPADDSPAR